MPLNRAYLEEIQEAENITKEIRQELETQLEEVESQLQLYDSPLFEPFRKLMASEEALAIKEMLNGPDENVLAKREKLRTLRHLSSQETKLRENRARLIRKLEEVNNG